MDELGWADAYPGGGTTLGEIWCLTFIEGLDERQALDRMGGLADTVASRTWSDIGALHTFDGGYPMVASALSLGAWVVLFEPDGFEGATMVAALSRGTRAITLLRHDYATPAFGYAENGELITGFDPTLPAYRHGTDPDRLLADLTEVGLADENAGDDRRDRDGAFARGLRLVERFTGALPTFEALTGPLTSAYIEPWFSAAPKPHASRPGPGERVDAVAEARRLTELHDLAGTPGLADALAGAERGETVEVTQDSPLGRHVRDWLTEARRASWSLNDHGGRYRMTEEQRRRGYDLGWLTRALGAALQQR